MIKHVVFFWAWTMIAGSKLEFAFYLVLCLSTPVHAKVDFYATDIVCHPLQLYVVF